MAPFFRSAPIPSIRRRTWNAAMRRIFADLRCLALLCFFTVLSSLLLLNFCANQIFTSSSAFNRSFSYFGFVDMNGIDDSMRIKASISEELIQLEKKRNSLAIGVTSFADNLRNLKNQIQSLEAKHRSLRSNIDQSLIRLRELTDKNTPMLAAPRSLDVSSVNWSLLVPPTLYDREHCSLDSCWDYAHCSITTSLHLYIYPLSNMCEADHYFRSRVLFDASISFMDKRFSASCAKLFVVCANSSETGRLQLEGLLHWFGDGRNHILVAVDYVSYNVLQSIDTGRSLVLSSFAYWNNFRWEFDMVLPHISVEPLDDSFLPSMVPIRRSVLTVWTVREVPLKQSLSSQIISGFRAAFIGQNISRVIAPDDCSCDESIDEGQGWCLCGTAAQRAAYFSTSDFALIPFDGSNSASQQLLWEALRRGAVPVLVGRALLPFEDVIDWRLSVLRFAASRVTELHYLLRTITDADIFTMRRHGTQVWKQYLSSPETAIKSVIAHLSERLGMLPSAPRFLFQDVHATNVENLERSLDSVDSMDSGVVTDEYLGPIETSVASAVFQHNFTISRLYSYERWNRQYWPDLLLPIATFYDYISSDAKFNGSFIGFRHINNGAGGSGREFSLALGGNVPYEQFTVVILTYDRHKVLMKAIERLRGVPYLNKVLIVWNGEWPIQDALPWPKIDVPIEVVSTGRNSLNNRFIPFDQIETEAILSLDDDIVLRHDEIVFGFRVWREQRDRIVGFPGRFHAWDPLYGGWHYNSNHSCELSIVLTGAAFFHKYYSYMYTYWMSQRIRDKVDELMNCEDIALNFLVSHITQKPPVKTTTRWTFRCPDCAASISERSNHFADRSTCINYFSRVYGYTPLLYTQYRADSVLYKTRLPPEHQKCFRIV